MGAAALLPGLASAGVALPSSPAFAPPAGVVVDATGASMGPYYPAFTALEAAVLLSIDGQAVIVPLKVARKDPAGMVPSGNGSSVFYESADCSGQAWVIEGQAHVPGTVAAPVIATGSTTATVFVPAARLSKNERQFKSQFFKVAQCGAVDFAGQAYPVDQAVDLSTLYAAPYHVQ
jgi:hypothetical protein